MKKIKNKGLLVLSIVLFIFIVGSITYRLLQDENKLTVTEKNYINNNRSKLININILNNINVFGNAGKGVFYDFLADFIEKRGLSFNQVAITTDNTSNGLTLSKGSTIPNNAKVFYTDHFVLVSKNNELLNNTKNCVVGILTRDESRVRKYISSNMELKAFDKKEALLSGFTADEVDYILVPRIEYLDVILDNLYHVIAHFSDIKDYYYVSASESDILTSIIGKYYNEWMNDEFKKSFNKSEYELFTKSLRITEKEIDIINSKEYTYGFLNNAPYDISTSGTYGGIISLYLKEFSDFSGISFNYNRYKNANKLSKAINKKEVDLYLNYNNINTNFSKIDSLFTMDISFIMSNSDERVFTSAEGIKSYKIYVLSNSPVESYLKSAGYTVESYNKDSKLKNIFKKNGIVALDYLSYLIYKNENRDINERFRISTNTTYNFMSDNDSMFNRLFYYYTSITDKNELMYLGIDNYYRTKSTGTLVYNIIKYALGLIIIVTLIAYLIYKFSKKSFNKKKIKKNDKMKYIDLLTSVKNRNYLVENLPIWNQNTIYPQSVIVIDLNGIQELNDSYGYQEGDKQIQALANILIKTQLDNTEVMRTDGNEFTVYMVGYSEKQVLSYIKKLNKELKNLPHEQGAAIGFSMIESDVKLIDDAINEATEKMKENKLLFQGEEDEKEI